MSKQKTQEFKLVSGWSINQSGKSLLISGGADARYEIELEDDARSFFALIANSKSFTRDKLTSSDQRVLEELVTAEIVVPVLHKGKDLSLAIIGDSNQLKLDAQKNMQVADILIVVRSNSTYAELLENIKYQSLIKPHLFVDVAYHHTLSIGPLVFPGETACIACLQGRISTRWSDEAPPALPRMAKQYPGVISELIKTEVERIAKDDTSLTNKTVSWNFLDRVVKKDQLLKVPLCPICTQNKPKHSGALVLPWRKDEDITNTV